MTLEESLGLEIKLLDDRWEGLKTQLQHELEQREISFDLLEDLGQDTGQTFGCIHMLEYTLKIINDMEVK